jgi:hypothetical protein
MRTTVKAALERIIADANYRAAVEQWIVDHRASSGSVSGWTGKSDANGVPVMNICSGGPPVTVAVETIEFAIINRSPPDNERELTFPKI